MSKLPCQQHDLDVHDGLPEVGKHADRVCHKQAAVRDGVEQELDKWRSVELGETTLRNCSRPHDRVGNRVVLFLHVRAVLQFNDRAPQRCHRIAAGTGR